MARGSKDMPPRGRRGNAVASPPGAGREPVKDTTPEGIARAEAWAKLRCGGCGRRLGKLAFEFVTVQALKDPMALGSPERLFGRADAVACARPDCDFAMRCAKDATAVRRLSHEWLFLDDPRVRAMFNDGEEEQDAEDGDGAGDGRAAGPDVGAGHDPGRAAEGSAARGREVGPSREDGPGDG